VLLPRKKIACLASSSTGSYSANDYLQKVPQVLDAKQVSCGTFHILQSIQMMLQNLELRNLNCWRCCRIAPILLLNREVLAAAVTSIIKIRLEALHYCYLPKVRDNVFAASFTNTAINISYVKFCYY